MFPQRPGRPALVQGDRSRLEARHTIPLSAGRTFQVVRLRHDATDDATRRATLGGWPEEDLTAPGPAINRRFRKLRTETSRAWLARS
jgi:hypothetical protein